MVKCQKTFGKGKICNRDLEEGFKYCPSCGTSVSENIQGSDNLEEGSISNETEKSVPDTMKTDMNEHEDPGGGKDSETSSNVDVYCSAETTVKNVTEKQKVPDGIVSTDNEATKKDCTAEASQDIMKDESNTEKALQKELKEVQVINKNCNLSKVEDERNLKAEKNDRSEGTKGQSVTNTKESNFTVEGRENPKEQSKPEDTPIQDSDFICCKDEEKVKELKETTVEGDKATAIDANYATGNILSSTSSEKSTEDVERGKLTENNESEKNKEGKSQNTRSGNTSGPSNLEKIRPDKVNNNITEKEEKEKVKETKNSDGRAKTEKESENQQRKSGDNQSSKQTEKDRPEIVEKRVVKVIFHAFLAPNVKINLQKDKIFVVFGQPCGDWEIEKGELLIATESQVKTYPTRLRAVALIEKDLLREPLRYAYKFQYQEKTAQKLVTESEFYLNGYEPYRSRFRLLNIPFGVEDEWNQYDGCIYATQKGILFTLREKVSGNFQDVMLNDGKYILCKYLSNVKECIKAGKQLDGLKDIFKCVKQGGIKDQFLKSPKKPDEFRFKQQLWDHLKIAIEVLLDTKEKDKGHAVLTAIAIMELIKDLDIPLEIIDYLHVEFLKNCLVLSPITDQQVCEQLDYLEKHLPKDAREKVKSSIVTFLKLTTISGNHVDPTWLACMPLVHYLEGSLHPFVPLDLRQFEITETKEDQWWCFSEFKQEKNQMKKNLWTKTCEEFVQIHRPLFQLDAALQKTFMAVLGVHQVSKVIPISDIQLEIKLATIEHYFEISSQAQFLQEHMSSVYAILLQTLKSLSADTIQTTWAEVDVKHTIRHNLLIAILNHALQRMLQESKLILTCFHCSLLSIAILDKITVVCKELESLPALITIMLDEYCGSRGIDLQIGDYALSIKADFPLDHLPGNFERTIVSAVDKYLNLCDTRKVVEMYINGMFGVKSEVLRSLVERKTFSSFEDIIKDRDFCGIFQYAEDVVRNNLYIPSLLSQFFQKVWTLDLNASPTDYLEQILTCNCYPQYVESYYQKGLLLNYMDGESVKKLKKSLSILQDFFTALENNSIAIQDLILGLKHSENLRNIAEKLESIADFDLPLVPDSLSILLECREKDMKTLNDGIKIVEGLRMYNTPSSKIFLSFNFLNFLICY